MPPWHGCLSVVSVVCCQVEVSATNRSLIQRSPTQCVVPECKREASTMSSTWLRARKFKWGSTVHKWSDVGWTDVIYVKWFCFEVQWNSVKWVTFKFLGTKVPCTYIRVTLYWGYLSVLWLFYLVCILYCRCFNWFCNVWVSVCGCVLTTVWVFW